MYFLRKVTLAAFTLTLLTIPSIAASSCAEVDQKLTKQRKSEYAQLISKSLDGKVKPSKVEVDGFMMFGTWSVVYASTPIADPGYFFFDNSSGKQVFKDVWGGMAEEGDSPELVKFAKNLGANAQIASCFSHTVIGD